MFNSFLKFIIIVFSLLFISKCVPPKDNSRDYLAEKMKLDSLRNLKCPRLLSSAGEYYRNRDWKQTIRIYAQITRLDCDQWDPVYANPKEIYQYYSIAYEQLGKFDSAEYVLLDGLQKIPNDIPLRKRLAYVYKRQGKEDKEVIEYERLVDLDPNDIDNLIELSKIYKESDRIEDQIFILQKILNVDKDNETAQTDLAVAFESSGRNPLDVYKERYNNNSDNISYGIDYSKRLIKADKIDEAISILNSVIIKDPNGKMAYRELAEAYIAKDDLNNASKTFETIFKIDPRDILIAIKLSDLYIDLSEFGKALRWADKSVSIDPLSGKGLGQKGKVYYLGWDNFRQNPFSRDDKVVAKLAYDFFDQAELKGYRGFNKKNWLEDNAKDVLYGKAQWFMASPNTKRSKVIRVNQEYYSWVTDILEPESSWK